MAVGDNAKILKERTHSLPEVNFSDEGPLRHLHLGTERVQGSMLMDAPTVLLVLSQ
jgi:spermidine synthase